MTTDASHSGPWYRYFWPWFITVLLGTTVIAGIGTTVIAFRGADSLVSDDYYLQGKAINQALAADREAALREVVARVRLHEGVSIELDILGDAPKALELELSHITRAELDRRLHLDRTPEGLYSTSETLPTGLFYATLRPAGAGATWRLRRRVDLPADRSQLLELLLKPNSEPMLETKSEPSPEPAG